VKPQDFVVCQDVQNRISFRIEENFAIRLTRKSNKSRLYTGKVGHVNDQTFHVHDANRGELLMEFDLEDFFTWDFDVSNTKYEIKVSKKRRKSIIFPVTHLWIDLNEFQMEFFNKDAVVCRKRIILPWFMSKWVIDNAIVWALGSILSIGKES